MSSVASKVFVIQGRNNFRDNIKNFIFRNEDWAINYKSKMLCCKRDFTTKHVACESMHDGQCISCENYFRNILDTRHSTHQSFFYFLELCKKKN